MREVCNLYHSHLLVSPHPRPTRSTHAVTGTFWEVMAGGHWPFRPGGIWHIMTYSILFEDAAWWAAENSLITWKFDRMNMIECCFSLSPMIFYANLPSESLTQPESKKKSSGFPGLSSNFLDLGHSTCNTTAGYIQQELKMLLSESSLLSSPGPRSLRWFQLPHHLDLE